MDELMIALVFLFATMCFMGIVFICSQCQVSDRLRQERLNNERNSPTFEPLPRYEPITIPPPVYTERVLTITS